MGSDSTRLVAFQTCPGCRTRKPLSEYPPKESGWRVCLTCLPRAQFSAETQRRQEEAARKFRRLLYEHDVPNLKRPPKTSEMLAALMEEFGGTEAYVHELAMQMQQMAANKPGHSETVRLFQAVLKFVHDENKRQDQVEQNALTREQIAQSTQVAVFSFMAEAALDEAKAALMLELLQPTLEKFNEQQPPPTLTLEVADAQVQQ